jgi:uncharacterized protein with PIN domain
MSEYWDDESYDRMLKIIRRKIKKDKGEKNDK